MYEDYNDEQQNNESGSQSSIPSPPGVMERLGQQLPHLQDNFNKLMNQSEKTANGDFTKEMGNEATKKTGEETGKSAAKEAGKEAAKEAGKETAKTAAEAGVAATGVGAIPVALEKVLTIAANIGKKGVDTVTESVSGTKVGLKEILMIIIFFFIFSYYVAVCGIYGMVGASSESYHEDQYGYTYSGADISDSDTKVDVIALIKNFIFKFFDIFESIGLYNSEQPYEESLGKNIEIFNEAFRTSYKLARYELFGIIKEREYDEILTLESFNENEYPFNNINYAELISIVSEKDTYNVENIKYSVFKKLFKADMENEKLKYLYCMKVEDAWQEVTFYQSPDGVVIRLGKGENVPDEEGGTTFTEELKYGKVTLKHYDLKSLYEMLELDAYSENEHWGINNIDVLEDQEEYIRYYSRDYDLGTTERTIWDWGFSRTDLMCSEEDFLSFLELLQNSDVSEIKQVLLNYAISKLGTTYSQQYRNQEGYFDCSSFVSWCYRQIGIEFGSYSPTAASICKYLESNSMQVSNSYTSLLVPGDLIFYSSKDNGRYKDVTHVAMYVGNGKIVDASSSKGEVVYRDIWGLNQIVSVCRPLQGGE